MFVDSVQIISRLDGQSEVHMFTYILAIMLVENRLHRQHGGSILSILGFVNLQKRRDLKIGEAHFYHSL